MVKVSEDLVIGKRRAADPLVGDCHRFTVMKLLALIALVSALVGMYPQQLGGVRVTAVGLLDQYLHAKECPPIPHLPVRQRPILPQLQQTDLRSSVRSKFRGPEKQCVR